MKPLLFVSPLQYFAPSILIIVFNNELYAQAETVEHTLRSVFTRGFLNEIATFSNSFCQITSNNNNNNIKNPQMVALLLLLSSLRRLWMKQGTENINSSPPFRFLAVGSLCVFSGRSCRCMLGRPRPNRLISPLYG